LAAGSAPNQAHPGLRHHHLDTPHQHHQLTLLRTRGELDAPVQYLQIGFFAVTFLIAIVAGLLVWHFTRANQARLGIRSRRGQIKNLWGDVRTFAVRGVVVLIVLILLVFVALKL
jgi:hypothetical protein